MDENPIIFSKGIGPFRTRAFIAAAGLSFLWMMLAPVIEVTVIALNENLRGYPNAKDYFSAKLFLSAGLKGLVAWIAIFTLMPLVSGITVALLSPGAECFNTAFPNSLSNSGGTCPRFYYCQSNYRDLGTLGGFTFGGNYCGAYRCLLGGSTTFSTSTCLVF